MFKNLKKFNLHKQFKVAKLHKHLLVVIAIGVLIIGNLIFSKIPLRLDLSKGRAYTLSSSTKKVLKNATKPVDIAFYVSSDIPSRLLPLRTEVIELLNEYKKQHSKVQIKVLDPKKDEKIARKAEEVGVPRLQFSQLEQDKYNITASTFGITVQYDGKTELIPQATELGSLEYSITSAIYRMTKTELSKVGFVGETMAFDPRMDRLASLRTVLQQQVEIEDVNISTESAQILDSSYKAVVVFDTNQKSYTSEEVEKLKKYINDKGKVIVVADGVWVPSDLNGPPLEAKHNLFDLISEYGITLNKDLILSNSFELVNFGNGVVSFVSPYPYWVKTSVVPERRGDFANVSHLTFPWTSSLSLEKKKGYKVEPIVSTVEQSWRQSKDFTLFPQEIREPKKVEFQQFTLAAQSMKRNGGGVVAIANSRLVSEEFIQRENNNLEFMLNLIDNLASGGALSGIRHREVNFYPLPKLSDYQKDMVKYGTMVLLPALFALYGTWRIVKRK